MLLVVINLERVESHFEEDQTRDSLEMYIEEALKITIVE